MSLSESELKAFKKLYEEKKVSLVDLREFLDNPENFAEEFSNYVIFDTDSTSLELILTDDGKSFVRDVAAIETVDKKLTEEEKEQIKDILKDPKLLETINDKLGEWVVGEQENKIFVYLVAVSSLSPYPIAIVITGESSSGKSYLVKNVLKFFQPKRDYYYITRSTGSALDRIGEGKIDLKKKIVYLAEFKGSDEAIEQLKLGLSEGKLGLFTTRKTENGNYEADMIETEMDIAFITTHLNVNLPQDMLNRTFITSCDLTEEQTKRILDFQTQEAIYGKDALEAEDEEVELIREIPQILEQYNVIVPYAESLEEVLPTDKIRVRRDFKKIIRLIQNVTFLYQYQRPRVKVGDEEKLIATVQDLMVASFIMEKSLGETILNLPDYELQFYNNLMDMEENEFKATEISEMIGKTKNTVYTYMKDLENAGLVVKRKEGSKNVYKLLENTVAFHDLFEQFLEKLEENFTTETVRRILNDLNLDVDAKELYERITSYEKLNFIEEPDMRPETSKKAYVEEVDKPYNGYCVIGNHEGTISYIIHDEKTEEKIECCDVHVEEAKEVFNCK